MCTWKSSVIEEGQARAISTSHVPPSFVRPEFALKWATCIQPGVESVLKTLTRLTQSVKPDWERACFQPPCLKHVERHLVGVHNRTSLVRLLPPSALFWVFPLQEMIDAYGCG